MRALLTLFLVFSVPLLAACPDNGATSCTGAVETAMKAATGRVSPTDAGTLVTLHWPAPATPSELALDYFQQAQLAPGAARANRFVVTSASEAEAEFPALGGGFSFTVSFPEPDRLGLGGCKGTHGGMADQVELAVAVSAPSDAGTRTVSTSADISLGAY